MEDKLATDTTHQVNPAATLVTCRHRSTGEVIGQSSQCKGEVEGFYCSYLLAYPVPSSSGY
ncbi:hypothetical protein J6590_079118 [Homalodisca vitripennis]|nr:hypothetical protein J6590_079118 [Homalodisca vitripennis]